MEKNYNIEISYLEEINELLKEIGDFQAYSDSFLIERLIDRLSHHYSFSQEPFSLETQILEDLGDLSFYKPFYPYSRAIISKSIFSGDYTPKYQSVSLSDEETILLAQDFLSKQNSQYRGYMDDFLEDAPEHVQFIEPNSHTDGETTFLKSTGDFFSVVPNYGNITKATILTHEVTHIFDWFKNENFISQFLIHEFHALLMEMLSSDYYNDCLGLEEDNKKRRLTLHSLIQTDSKDIYCRMQILHLYQRFGREKGMQKIKETFARDYLQYTAQYSLVETFLYQVSYLLAVELYTMYQKDKEKALWIVDQIVSKGTNQNIRKMLDSFDIHLLEHFHEYETGMLLKKTI